MDSKELEELKKLSGSSFAAKLRYNPDLKKKCLDYFGFLDHVPDNREMYWYIQNNMTEQVKCFSCGKLITIKGKKPRACSLKCGRQRIDPETGLTVAQTTGRKGRKTKMDAIDPETGLTIAQRAALKTAETRMNTIDPETGLTIAQASGRKGAETRMNMIDPETGLTVAQTLARKSAETRMNTIDPESGLSIAQASGRKGAETRMNTIDPETGLTIAQASGRKGADLRMNTIDPESGLTIANSAALKGAETRMNTIDPETGLSVAQTLARKSAETSMNTINPATGLSIAKSVGKKSGQTRMNTIDPETGLSIAKSAGKKGADLRMNTIDPETGLSVAQTLARKSAITTNKPIFDKRVLHEKGNGYEILTSYDEYTSSSDKQITYRHIECGEIRSSYHRYVRCLKCFPYNKSMGEVEILNFCESLVGETSVISNDRQIIKPKELDIVVPDYGLAIEYDGLYWHSSNNDLSEYTTQHLEKTSNCEEKGLNLLHIFENEWESTQKQQIWKSIIRNKLGKSNKIYARKCEIRKVSNKESVSFLETNHLQGNAPASIRYGLYHDDILVALMTFGKSRFNKNVDWELIRYCNSLNTSVVGGASRLFKHFLKNHTGSIISYADRRHSQGGLYQQLGFEFSHNSDPNYYYYENKQPYILESRQKYQKHKLHALLENFDPDQTESQNMYKNGYRKIYDCGNQVWIFNRDGV
jgi:archaellin